MNRFRALVLLVVCLSAVGPCFADTLSVTFSVTFDNAIPAETVSGSFLWNTTTEVLSNIAISSVGAVTYLPVVQAVTFEPAGSPHGYPPGSIIFLAFPDVALTGNVQINFGDHAFFDAPLKPEPGTYSAPFDMTGGGIGVIPSSGEVEVAATPEPRSLALLSFGLLTILVALGGKQFFTTRLRQA